MAGRISELAPLTGANAAPTDLIEVLDVSDTSMAASGTNKQMSLAQLASSPAGIVLPQTGIVVVDETGYVPGNIYPFNGYKKNTELNQQAGDMFLIPTVFAADCVVNSVGFCLAGTTTAERRAYFSLYADTGGCAPGAKVATFGELVLPNGTGPGMKSITGLSVAVSKNKLYWVGFTPNWTQNGGADWWYTVANLVGQAWGCTVISYDGSIIYAFKQTTGYVSPPSTAAASSNGMQGWGAPWLWFTVS